MTDRRTAAQLPICLGRYLHTGSGLGVVGRPTCHETKIAVAREGKMRLQIGSWPGSGEGGGEGVGFCQTLRSYMNISQDPNSMNTPKVGTAASPYPATNFSDLISTLKGSRRPEQASGRPPPRSADPQMPQQNQTAHSIHSKQHCRL